jgi:prepilin-type N-terminal cleavage/methylation domain-containing protein
LLKNELSNLSKLKTVSINQIKISMKKNQTNIKNSKKLGFSLIELSIVILVIGILVLGITKGSAIISKAKIGSARSLTNSSPASVTPDLVAWYEPSMKSSFLESEAFDATAISTWYDNSPNKNLNASQSSSSLKPLYYESVINNLPAVRFAGTDDIMTFNANSFLSSDYTVFVVEQRRAATGVLVNFGGTTVTNSLGYTASTTLADSTAGSATVAAFASGSLIPRIITFVTNNSLDGSSNARNIFVNGTIGTTGTDGAKITFTSGITTGKIGNDDDSVPYTGDIAVEKAAPRLHCRV